MKWLYWLFGACYHEWSRWEPAEFNVTIANPRTPDRPVKRSDFIQTHRCNKCGLTEQASIPVFRRG